MKKVLFFAMLVFATGLLFSCSSDDLESSDPGSADKGDDIGNYKTVVIGTQTWMAENLNYAVAGSKCYGEGGIVGENSITKTLSPAEVQANCVKYGRLYDWATAMALPSSCNENSCSGIQPKHRGICPSGWHIPSNDDWGILINYVGGSSTAGAKLKAKSSWNENGNGTDQYGFSALPGGEGGLADDGSFFVFWSVGYTSYWWSANEDDDSKYEGEDKWCESDSCRAYRLRMYYDRDIAGYAFQLKDRLLSVRCLQD